eukprot:jgi/Ulvmu1/12157/UM085_0021.1
MYVRAAPCVVTFASACIGTGSPAVGHDNMTHARQSAGVVWQSVSKHVGTISYATSSFLRRNFATKPDATVYGGPKAPVPSRVTLRVLQQKYRTGQKISMVTAYDYPSAVHVDKAGIDILLVGDSAGMVIHGHDTTVPVTLEMMLLHCQAASRGASRPFLLGDMPFGTYEISKEQAVSTAMQFLKKGNVDAVKVEGGSTSRVQTVEAIVGAGIACMGHIGLTPQSVSAIGGFRPQAQKAEAATTLVQTAKALETAGCFAVLMECVPAAVAAAVTKALSIPTIGIGAGPDVSGQVLVFHDLLGMMSHPHHQQVTPKFCKQYAQVGLLINDALTEFRRDVETGGFPGKSFSPYKMAVDELRLFVNSLDNAGLSDAAEAAMQAADKTVREQ